MIEPMPIEIINWGILNEIISMDEDDPDFSKGLIIQFIDQAETTFGEMDEQLNKSKDLSELEKLGHFLKGSSAALGLQRIAWSCERIQNLGRKAEKSFPSKEQLLDSLPADIELTDSDKASYEKSNSGVAPTSEDDELYLFLIKRALAQARLEFQVARRELSAYYNEVL
ncbi:similar to Saccharomyces cerevisiae YDL235C YPD1 Phosphorelay intermediate protein [Maudiozyma saulgeensis]|uniref:Phosphorelay intermediate protein YPD1 n=1 Tax=Maudiozyma saulgeensis TaxID=1789683 RepID=A0A1X7R6X8_9SACH|nr:similar to Saccharomyces cerevisiae YDL235C YPD1 Phosphorelay intermediate protein [Kazachstania saulgeensis]